jgi:hypothetical protein
MTPEERRQFRRSLGGDVPNRRQGTAPGLSGGPGSGGGPGAQSGPRPRPRPQQPRQ